MRNATVASVALPGGFHDGDWVESKDQDPDGSIRLLQLADVGDGLFRDRSDRRINDETFERLNCSSVRPGDVLIARMPDPLGRACIVPEGIGPAVTVVDVAVLRCDDAKADRRFVTYAINSAPTRSFMESLQDGATRQRIPRRRLGRVQLPLPELSKQRAIADYLDRETARIDTLIEDQQRLIETLRERRVAVVAHATAQGSDVEFRRVIASLRQGWSPNCESFPADGIVEWGVLKVGCANTGRFDPSENKRLPEHEIPRPESVVRKGDLVMSRSNTKDLVGAAAMVDQDYPRLMLSDLTYSITLVAGADPAFVAYALGSPALRIQISAASKGMSHSMQKISQRDIRELRLQLPPLDEQRRIAEYLDEQTAKIDTLIAETERFIELSKERRAALITAAVTGQIDLRETA